MDTSRQVLKHIHMRNSADLTQVPDKRRFPYRENSGDEDDVVESPPSKRLATHHLGTGAGTVAKNSESHEDRGSLGQKEHASIGRKQTSHEVSSQ